MNRNITILIFAVKFRVASSYGQQLHRFIHRHHTQVTSASGTVQTTFRRKYSPFLLTFPWFDVIYYKVELHPFTYIQNPLYRAAKTKKKHFWEFN